MKDRLPELLSLANLYPDGLPQGTEVVVGSFPPDSEDAWQYGGWEETIYPGQILISKPDHELNQNTQGIYLFDKNGYAFYFDTNVLAFVKVDPNSARENSILSD
jgi:hypothetical protein